MPQSLSKLYVHLVFSTKNREPWLNDNHPPRLHDYLGGTLHGLDCPPVEINSEPDHVHFLFLQSRQKNLSDIVYHIKRRSNDWVKNLGPHYERFGWQNGYGAFSVSQSGVPEVREYIRNQREHHRNMSFQEEHHKILHRYEVAFDERYVWD